MKLQVTRRQVLKAIKTEPLKANSYFHMDDQEVWNEDTETSVFVPDFAKFKNKAGCAVCAVGSILDCSLGDKMGASELAGMAGILTAHPTIESLTERMQDDGISQDWITNGSEVSVRTLVNIAAKEVKKRPLSALSSLFEAIMDRDGMTTKGGLANYRARRILVKFVKNHFPTKLTLDTNKSY